MPTHYFTNNSRAVLKPSWLVFDCKNAPALTSGFAVADRQQRSFDEHWQPVWSDGKTIRNHYHELATTRSQAATERPLRVQFRVFDDGLGFQGLAASRLKQELVKCGGPKGFAAAVALYQPVMRRLLPVCTTVNSLRARDTGPLTTAPELVNTA